jgi:hypothetical protein
MNLSEHFTLEELTASDIATRRGIGNTPGPLEQANLTRIAATLEQVRALLGVPMHINSGYRSPTVNRAVGGSATSAHCDGRAADFIAPEYGTPQEVARAIRDSAIQFDQLIYEGTWVHIGIPADGAQDRHQVLTAHFDGGPATYTEGIA